MFQNACKKAQKFTHPVVLRMRFLDDNTDAGVGSFVVINKEGWILTAAHIITPLIAYQEHQPMIAEYEKKKSEIDANKTLTGKQKDKAHRALKFNPKWITHIDVSWGPFRTGIGTFMFNGVADIAAGKLENFDPNLVEGYPVFKKAESIEIGTSLCKLGFPLNEVEVKFNNDSGSLETSDSQVTFFALEGMYARNLQIGTKPDGKPILWIEMTSPGLRGQSGGPIFDVEGRVWGVQNNTASYPLGFNVNHHNKKNKELIEASQLLHVGRSTHPETLVDFLSENKIDFQMA